MSRKTKKQDVASALATLLTALVDERRERYYELVEASEVAESYRKTAIKLRKELDDQPAASDAKSKRKGGSDPRPKEELTLKLNAAEQSFDNWKLKVDSVRGEYERINDILRRAYDIDRDYTDGKAFAGLFG